MALSEEQWHQLWQLLSEDEMNYDPGLCVEMLEKLSDEGIVAIDWTRVLSETVGT